MAVRHERYEVPCGKRSCPACGVLWLGDSRIRALAAANVLGDDVTLVSITAPGADRLPWSDDGRTVDEEEARAWNEAAPGQWSRLWARASRAARRYAKRRGVAWCLLLKSWEYQKRGVLHLHLVLPYGCPVQREATRRCVAALDALRHEHEFGFVDRGQLAERGPLRRVRRLRAVAAGRAAAYVAGYMASTGAGKEGIAEVARKQGVPGAILYVSRTLTDESGVTMRTLRARRRIAGKHHWARVSAQAWEAGCLVDAVQQGRPPLTPAAEDLIRHLSLTFGVKRLIDAHTGEVLRPTAAPAPWAIRGEGEDSTRALGVAIIRLDSVWHGVSPEAVNGPVVTVAEVVPWADQERRTLTRESQLDIAKRLVPVDSV